MKPIYVPKGTALCEKYGRNCYIKDGLRKEMEKEKEE